MGVDISKLKDKMEHKSAERTNRLELLEGDNELRILPPSLEYLVESVDYIGYEYLVHYKLGPEDNRQSAICPKTFGKAHKCPVCETVARLYRMNTPEDKALASTIRSKRRFIFNAIDLKAPEKGIQILETGPKIYEAIVEFVTNPKWGDLLDLDKGHTITITKTDSKKTDSGYTEYSVMPDPSRTSIRESLPQDFKSAIGFLKKSIPEAKTYEELKAILEGEVSSVDTGKVKSTASTSDDAHSTTPKVVEKEESIKSEPSKAEVMEEVKPSVKEVQKKEPECFGKSYGPRRPECSSCNVKPECRQKFMEI